MSTNLPLSKAERDEAVLIFRFGKHRHFHEVAHRFGELAQEIAIAATCWAYDANEDYEELLTLVKAMHNQESEFFDLVNRYRWQEAKSLASLVESGNQQLQELAAEQGGEG
jgi:hypothetical protein